MLLCRSFLRETFHLLAADELEHARVIGMVMQTPDRELDATPGLSKELIDEMLSMTKELLACAESRELSANEALKLALQVEEQLTQVHANNSLTPGNPRLAAFFDDLSNMIALMLINFEPVSTPDDNNQSLLRAPLFLDIP